MVSMSVEYGCCGQYNSQPDARRKAVSFPASVEIFVTRAGIAFRTSRLNFARWEAVVKLNDQLTV